MSILRTRLSFEDHYTQIPNAWLRDARLSWKARGLLAYLLSHREGWEVTLETLVRTGTDGITAVRAAVNELEQAGYLNRERTRTPDGTRLAGVNYLLSDPWEENLTSENLTQGNLTPKKTIPSEDQVEETPPLPGLEPVPAGTKLEQPDGFELFWHQWPKKVARIEAVKFWKKMPQADRDEALVGVVRVKAMVDQKQQDRQYLPNPDRWLRGRRWEDFQAEAARPAAPVSLSRVDYNAPAPEAVTPEEKRQTLQLWEES